MQEDTLESLVSKILKLKYELDIRYDKDLAEMMGWSKTRVSNLLNIEILKKDAEALIDKMIDKKKSKD